MEFNNNFFELNESEFEKKPRRMFWNLTWRMFVLVFWSTQRYIDTSELRSTSTSFQVTRNQTRDEIHFFSDMARPPLQDGDFERVNKYHMACKTPSKPTIVMDSTKSKLVCLIAAGILGQGVYNCLIVSLTDRSHYNS